MIIRKIRNKITRSYRKSEKKRKIDELLNLTIDTVTDCQPVWSVKNENSEILSEKITIFGVDINSDDINWHLDYVSGFEYPNDRFDKIKISRWFDKGIDVKFPWELSRCYFLVRFTQLYRITGDEMYYDRFRNLIIDWINKNPFLFGINWHCTMEVAIRAANWVVAASIMNERLEKDIEFKKLLIQSLIQHAHYISAFPEIKPGGHTNNHAVADFAGLLFLSQFLQNYTEANKWRDQAVEGILQCMDYQVYDDGSHFEGSIPYHRLVLEMFGYSTLMCRVHEIDLPNRFYIKLFKMFEFTAAYMDNGGNAPQIGDNDSGRFLIFHDSDENDHSYLLDLGEYIFEYKYLSQCYNRNKEYEKWLPSISKITLVNGSYKELFEKNIS